MKLSTLKKKAQQATAWRGHRMKWGPVYGTPTTQSQNAECRDCAAVVSIHEMPAPNGIDIGGSAVAINCLSGRRLPMTNCNHLPDEKCNHSVN